MINKPIEVFKLMYLTLVKERGKQKDDRFGLYLSEADPFITGDDSADPAVFDEFKTAFGKYGSYDEYGYGFILRYLEELDPYYGDLKKYFVKTDKQQYLSDAEQYSSMSDEELIDTLHLYK